MTGPDPVDVRLLTAVAESGRTAVHELATRLGMDARDVAARLAVLSTTGLPMAVTVECDPVGIRNAVAAANAWTQQHSGGYPVPQNPPSGPHSGGQPVQPGQPPFVPQGPPPGFPPQGSGPHSGPQQSGPQPAPQQSGPHSGPQPAPPSGPQQSGPHVRPASGPHPAPQQSGPQVPPATGQQPPGPMSTWGPPGSAAWARAETERTPAPANAPTAQTPAPASARTGKVGSRLEVHGPEGERISIVLVEVVDPADFLFTAAGYQLQDGERSVVVHTELTNRGPMPYTSLPDLHLELVATDGSTIGKAPVSLSSRPPHRMGVPPGETAGGHTVYVLPEDTELTAVRWSPHSGADEQTLTWDITDL